MKKLILFVFVLQSIVSFSQNMEDSRIGYWQNDNFGLPCFNYTGNLPFVSKMPNGQMAKLPDDPWFLIGNYRLTVFTHVSGQYELICGERDWGRLNQGDDANKGLNSASVEIMRGNKFAGKYQLTGMNSVSADPTKCKRVFGVGFASYEYLLDNASCKRILSAKPSANPQDGTSAFLLRIILKNNSKTTLKLTYNESVTANYEWILQQHLSDAEKRVMYQNTPEMDPQLKISKIDIKGIANDPLIFPTKLTVAQVDGYPPSLFVKAISSEFSLNNTASGNRNTINASCEITLKPGEQKEVSLIVGYAYDGSFEAIEKICQQLNQPDNQQVKSGVEDISTSGSTFAEEWLKILPKLTTETDTQLKQEMIWHAYTLEAMAKYSDFYGETLIHQGTIYDYDWGIRASARDNFQHALPTIYTNPALARSILKYMTKRITSNGEIRLEECGYGYSTSRVYTTSDQQLWFLNYLSEYLRVTKDYSILLEKTKYYPVRNMPDVSILDAVERAFVYLRDEVGVGQHGLVKLLNSDWSDAVYYIKKVQYNRVLMNGESHMNSAMAVSILGELIPKLESYHSKPEFATVQVQIGTLTKSMSIFRSSVSDAFMKDLGDRTFSKRMFCDNQFYGEKNMFLEPQGFMLQMQNLPVEKKKALYAELQKRVYNGEKLGAREQEEPEFDDPAFDYGSRENGGVWYALNGPVICGVAQFDKPEAMRLLKQMSFSNYAKAFTNYWTSYWTGTDVIESSLIPTEGLCDQTTFHWTFPAYCAHSHAWLLYCYYKIKE